MRSAGCTCLDEQLVRRQVNRHRIRIEHTHRCIHLFFFVLYSIFYVVSSNDANVIVAYTIRPHGWFLYNPKRILVVSIGRSTCHRASGLSDG